MSWGGFLVIACLLLASTGVLLGALPLLSATSTSIDALGHRQARTLAGWLASAVQPDGGVDASIVDAVLSQPGVEFAMLLDASTGRAVAPAQAAGRQIDTLPLVGAEWRAVRVAQVEPAGGAFEAIVPTGGPGAPHVAWVRYERGGSGEGGLAVVVALGSTIALALLTSILIRRHTGATLQHFTRQVELVVSGANAKVMRGDLVPGLERLPGVVTYLLERRTDDAPASGAAAVASSAAVPGKRVTPATPAAVAPWIEVTPGLAVTAGQGVLLGEGPDAKAMAGKHLLDALTDAPLRNAVVQGLGALGAATGAEVTVATPDHGTFTLSRQAGGNVRVARLVR